MRDFFEAWLFTLAFVAVIAGLFAAVWAISLVSMVAAVAVGCLIGTFVLAAMLVLK